MQIVALTPNLVTAKLIYAVVLLFILLVGHNHIAHADTIVDPELRAALNQAVRDSSSFEDRFDAEVWLGDMSGRLEKLVPDLEHRLTLLRLIHQEAKRAELPPELVLAVIETESHFKRFAISSAGAQGLMQIMPFWLEELGRPDDNLTNTATNLRYGCTILKFYLDKEQGNLSNALARYNGSLGSHRYPDKVFTVLSEHWYR